MKKRCWAVRASWGALCGCLILVAPAVASDGGAAAAARVDEPSYRHYLDDLLYTHDGDDRGYGLEHDLARDNIAATMAAFGLTVTLEPFNYNGGTYYNVVGTKLGTLVPAQEYVIGAHFDSVGNPGADDNASGVALVLEAARILTQYDSDYTIRFIAFDREEQGLWGSEAYVLDHIGDDIRAAIAADMVAFNTGGENLAEIYGRTASNAVKTALADAVDLYGNGLIWDMYGALDGSDHAPFEWYGIPAALLIESWGNPYYHTQDDSVDTPNYIDYAYATKMTRVVVGFLVDHAAVHVVPVDGDYTGDGSVDEADLGELNACFSDSGMPATPEGCLFFDYDADGDVDCEDWRQFAFSWTSPEGPPTFWLCERTPPQTAEGGRCLAVTAPAHGLPLALYVTGDPGDPQAACMSGYVQADGSLGATPVYQMSDDWATVYVCDAWIVPSAAYHVCCEFDETHAGVFSPAVPAATARWADTVGVSTGAGWTQPNGIVDILDAVAILDKFSGLPSAPPLAWVDLVGMDQDGLTCSPDGQIDIIDAVVALDAFGGQTYTEATGCEVSCGP